MKNKVVELVNIWGSYEAENPDLTITDFCVRYLAENTVQLHNSDLMGIPINGQLAALMTRLMKFANLYFKKALEHTALNNVEDWVYLISLQQMGTPKKSELIYEMLSEFPSGIDIIKRLVAAKLVEEFPDENDKRSKRLKITELGRKTLFDSMPFMGKVGEMAFDTLNQSEKMMMANILKRLDNFHNEYYKTTRISKFEEVYEILVK